MRSVIAAVVVVSGLLLFAVPGEAATKRQKYPFETKAQVARLSVSDGFPKPGATIVQAGVQTTTTSLGTETGAEIDRSTITGQSGESTWTYKGRGEDFGSLGVIKSKYTGEFTILPDGSTTGTGRGKIVGGSGPYKRASGKFTFTSESPPDSTISTFDVTGTLILVRRKATGSRAEPQPFEFTGAGTNYVDVATGEVYREVWKGRAPPFGKITTRVAGFAKVTSSSEFTFQGSFVALTKKGDSLIGTCSGAGTNPAPQGHAQWTCHPTGGTGRFTRSQGQWTVDVAIERLWVRDGTQKHRFTVRGTGWLSYDKNAKLPGQRT